MLAFSFVKILFIPSFIFFEKKNVRYRPGKNIGRSKNLAWKYCNNWISEKIQLILIYMKGGTSTCVSGNRPQSGVEIQNKFLSLNIWRN